MKKYHKIQTVFHRDPDTNFRTVMPGMWALPEFEFLQGCQWEWTEKVDGTNIRIGWDGERVTFGGKTDAAQIPAQLANTMKELLTPEVMRGVFTGPATLYGEGFGAKIQKVGHLYGERQGFILFDVHCGGLWLERHNVEAVAAGLGCPVVPVVGRGTLHEMVALVQRGLGSELGDLAAEGIVARPVVEVLTRNGARIITKLKARDFGGARDA